MTKMTTIFIDTAHVVDFLQLAGSILYTYRSS